MFFPDKRLIFYHFVTFHKHSGALLRRQRRCHPRPSQDAQDKGADTAKVSGFRQMIWEMSYCSNYLLSFPPFLTWACSFYWGAFWGCVYFLPPPPHPSFPFPLAKEERHKKKYREKGVKRCFLPLPPPPFFVRGFWQKKTSNKPATNALLHFSFLFAERAPRYTLRRKKGNRNDFLSVFA